MEDIMCVTHNSLKPDIVHMFFNTKLLDALWGTPIPYSTAKSTEDVTAASIPKK